jgi:hypothetical protein
LEVSSVFHPHFEELTFEALQASNGLTFPHGYCKCDIQILYLPGFINASIPYLYKKFNALGFFCGLFFIFITPFSAYLSSSLLTSSQFRIDETMCLLLFPGVISL